MNDNFSTTLVKAQQIKDYIKKQENGCTLTEIAKNVKLNKTTTYRLLQTLVTLKDLIKVNRRYYLNQYFNANYLPVGWLACRIVQPLVNKYELSAFLGMPFNQQLVITQVIAFEKRLNDFHQLGKAQAFNTSAMGKCALAFMNQTVQTDVLTRTKLQTQTKNSLTDQNSLAYSLQIIKDQGYALDDEEVELENRYLAVPVFDKNEQLVGTLGVLGTKTTLQRRKINKLVHDLQIASSQLTGQIFNN